MINHIEGETLVGQSNKETLIGTEEFRNLVDDFRFHRCDFQEFLKKMEDEISKSGEQNDPEERLGIKRSYIDYLVDYLEDDVARYTDRLDVDEDFIDGDKLMFDNKPEEKENYEKILASLSLATAYQKEIEKN